MSAAVLELRSVKKRFGGLWAVDGLDLSVRTGESRAIIGPNGAGKSTLFNLISGHLRADSGTIRFRGADISRESADQICRRGMSRTFQITSIFPQLTVLENVQVALFAHRRQSARLLDRANGNLVEEAIEVLGSVAMAPLAGQLSGTLSHAHQKHLELAMALASEPILLLLDEPTAGMPTRERHETMELVSRLVKERALALVFTEHDMDVVFSTAEWISVLHQGRLLAEGRPEAVRADKEVQRVYLGWKRPLS